MAQWDAWEGDSLRHVAPLRRKFVPVAAVSLAGALLWTNSRKISDPENKKKALLRDVLVLAGTTLGILAGWRFTASHGHQAAKVVRDTVQKRLGNLLKPQAHSHGLRELIDLELIAGGAVVGGGLSGLLADRINGEDLKASGTAKLKEGVFQFLGNITVCTLSVLAFSKLGNKIGQRLAKRPSMMVNSENLMKDALSNLVKMKAGHPSLMPTSLTTELETILLKKNSSPAQIRENLSKLLSAELPQVSEEARRGFLDSLNGSLLGREYDTVRQRVRNWATEAFQKDIQQLNQGLQADEGNAKATFAHLVQAQSENRGELPGMVLGLGAGIVGGAWLSNQTNGYLSRKFQLPQTNPASARFFSSSGQSSAGLLEGKLGERGVHWYDMVLHADDPIGAMYLTGAHALKSVIGILYGMSGYLVGTAGVDYTQKKRFPLKHPELYAQQTPLRRQGRIYDNMGQIAQARTGQEEMSSL